MTLKKCAAVAVALLLGLAVVGCGSKKGDTASTGDASQSEKQSEANPDASSTTTSKSGGTTSTTSGSNGLNGLNNITGGQLGDCVGASVAYATLVLEPLGFMGGATQEQIDKFEQDTKDVQSKIPSELQDDFQTVADAYKAYGDALKGIDFSDMLNPDTQKKVEDASNMLDDPQVKAAQDNIDAYFKDNCNG